MRLDILSENLKWLRITKRLRMEDIERDTGIPTSTLSHLERLETEPYETSFKNIVTLADYYGVSIDYLLGREHSEEVLKTEIGELNLTDNAVMKIKSDKRHGQILSALISLDSFSELLDRIEIFTDRSLEATYANLNQYYEALLLSAKKAGGADVTDEVIGILEQSHFNDSFDRYKIKEFIDVVLDELADKYGNKVLKENSVHSPLNEMLTAAAENADLPAQGNKPSVADIMSGIVGDVPEEQAELLQALIGGVSEAVSAQNFKLKRNRKFDSENET